MSDEREYQYVDGLDGVLKFVSAYEHAPPDADIEIAFQADHESGPLVRASIVGVVDLVMSADSARKLAQIFDDAMGVYPEAGVEHGFPNLIMGLRAAADKAESEA